MLIFFMRTNYVIANRQTRNEICPMGGSVVMLYWVIGNSIFMECGHRNLKQNGLCISNNGGIHTQEVPVVFAY